MFTMVHTPGTLDAAGDAMGDTSAGSGRLI